MFGLFVLLRDAVRSRRGGHQSPGVSAVGESQGARLVPFVFERSLAV